MLLRFQSYYIYKQFVILFSYPNQNKYSFICYNSMGKTVDMIEITPKIPSSKLESSDLDKYYLQEMRYETSPFAHPRYFK